MGFFQPISCFHVDLGAENALCNVKALFLIQICSTWWCYSIGHISMFSLNLIKAFYLLWVNIHYMKLCVTLQHFHMCAYDYFASYMHAYMCIHAHVEGRGQPPVLFLRSLLFCFWVRSFFSLGLTNYTRLACVPSAPAPGSQMCAPMYPFLYVSGRDRTQVLLLARPTLHQLSSDLCIFLNCRKWLGFCNVQKNYVKFKLQCPMWHFIETSLCPFT